MDEAILQLLRERPSHFLSGEEISRRLKVSRTAVWKKMRSLRALGYQIEASTRSGYRLVAAPDLLLPSEVLPLLGTKRLGRTIHHFSSIESTNSKAYELALGGAEEGEVVIAESQTGGRGRLGRTWFSPPSLNLYLSVILRPALPPQRAPLLTLLAAVATADAIESCSGIAPRIKWPNDILLRNRKVAGLLNELHSETDRIHFVILGMGVNLNTERRVFPEALQRLATSLKEETGQAVSRKVFLQILLEALEERYGRFFEEGESAILEAWREKAQVRGRSVEVQSFGEVVRGTAIDIDPDGALIVETLEGPRKRIVAGDLSDR